MKIEPYKNWEISYLEGDEKFIATKEEHRLENPSLKELKKKIDVFSFKREKVYYWTDNELIEAEITSKIVGSYDDYRISYMDTDYQGKPMKSNHGVSKDRLYTFNEENKELFEKINKRHGERKKLWDEIKDLQKTLDRFEAQDD